MRCKLKLTAIGRREHLSFKDGLVVKGEAQELQFAPIYDSNPESENGKFFAATPYGEVKLGVVSAEAVKDLVLGGEYFLDFTPAF